MLYNTKQGPIYIPPRHRDARLLPVQRRTQYGWQPERFPSEQAGKLFLIVLGVGAVFVAGVLVAGFLNAF